MCTRDRVNNELQTSGPVAKLPGGVMLTGGTAQITGIGDDAKEALQLAAPLGRVEGLGGVVENLHKPQYGCVLGLMMCDLEGVSSPHNRNRGDGVKGISIHSVINPIKNILTKFRS